MFDTAVTGKDPVGRETPRWPPWDTESLWFKSLIPLVYQDISEMAESRGWGFAATGGTMAFFGVGVNTYEDSERATRRRIVKLRLEGKGKASEALRLEYNRTHDRNISWESINKKVNERKNK